MGELEKLYAILKRDGYYTKSFTDFARQFNDESYRNKVYGVVSRDKLYTGSPEDFTTKFYNQIVTGKHHIPYFCKTHN